MRFIFRPPAAHAAGLLSLPWEEPLERWADDRLLEVFHEILEHRWFLSEKAGKDVGTTAAARSYVAGVLPQTPSTLTVLPGGSPPAPEANL